MPVRISRSPFVALRRNLHSRNGARAGSRTLNPWDYPAKAFGGPIGEIEAGRVKHDDVVVFVHTSGTPALFADLALYWHPD